MGGKIDEEGMGKGKDEKERVDRKKGEEGIGIRKE